MLKKIIMFSVLIPVYSFCAQQELDLETKKANLSSKIDILHDQRNSSICWAVTQVLIGISTSKALESNAVSKEDRAYYAILGLGMLGRSLWNFVDAIDKQRKINRESVDFNMLIKSQELVLQERALALRQ